MKHNLLHIVLYTIFTVLYFTCIPSVSTAADEVIVPGKISWAVISIDEVYTIDKSETSEKRKEKKVFLLIARL